MELKKHQPPMTVEEQIENLKSLGLIIDNEMSARTNLYAEDGRNMIIEIVQFDLNKTDSLYEFWECGQII